MASPNRPFPCERGREHNGKEIDISYSSLLFLVESVGTKVVEKQILIKFKALVRLVKGKEGKRVGGSK